MLHTVFTVAITNSDDLYVKIYRKNHIPFSLCCVLSHVLLCSPVDSSPLGSSVHGFFQTRTLELVAISFSRGSSSPRIDPLSLLSPALASRFFTASATSRRYDSRVVI